MSAAQLAALIITALISAAAVAAEGPAPRTPSPPDARLYFITPQDGDQVSSTFTVRFGLAGLGVSAADVERENTGHHHLLVDMDAPTEVSLARDNQVRHFGGDQTESRITLGPGRHTLQLLLGDRNHMPHEPPVMSDKITITVAP